MRRRTLTRHQSPEQPARMDLLSAFAGDLLRAQLDSQQVYELICEYFCRVLDAPAFVAQLLLGENEDLDEVIRWEHGQRQKPRHVPINAGTQWVVKTRQPFLSNHALTQPLPFAPWGQGQLPGSLLIVPLLAGDDLIGTLTWYGFEENAFDKHALDVVPLMANHAAMAIRTARAFEAERRRAQQLAAVSQVSRRIASLLEPERLFPEIARLIRDEFGCDHVAMFTVDAEKQALELRASTDPAIQELGLEVVRGEGVVGRVAEVGQPMLVSDMSHEPGFSFAGALKNTAAELAVPLRVEDRVIGVLDLQSHLHGAFEQGDLSVLQSLGDQVAVAIEDARLYGARQEEAWMSTALLQAAEALGGLDNLDDILRAAVRITSMLTGADRCSILLWHEEAQELVYADGYVIRPDMGPLLDSVRLQPGDSPVLDRLLSQPSSAASDAHWDADATLAEEPDAKSRTSILVLPLRAQGELYGIMAVDSAASRSPFSERLRAIMAGIADRAGMAIANVQLQLSQREEAWVATALLQVAQVFASSSNLDDSLTTVARLTSLLAGIDHCLIFQWSKEESALKPLQACGLDKDLLEAFHGLQLRAPVMPLIERMNEIPDHIVIDDARTSDLLPPGFARAFGFTSMLALPMTSRGEMVGMFLVDYAAYPLRFTSRSVGLLEGIAQQAAIAIENARLYEANLEQERVAQELRVAHDIQVSFLPHECPSYPGWEIAADWHAARGVGGDFYDFVPLDNQNLGLVIADVSDKGVPAALFMSLSRTLVRVCALETSSPAQALQRANTLIISDAHSDMFLTLFYGVLDWRTGLLTYANAGHNPPILWRGPSDGAKSTATSCNTQRLAADSAHNGAHFVELRAKGIALGVLDEITLQERSISIQPGDLLILYTDGVTEPINETEEEFGEQRLLRVIGECAEQPCNEIVRRVRNSVASFAGKQPQYDDYTLVCLKRTS